MNDQRIQAAIMGLRALLADRTILRMVDACVWVHGPDATQGAFLIVPGGLRLIVPSAERFHGFPPEDDGSFVSVPGLVAITPEDLIAGAEHPAIVKRRTALQHEDVRMRFLVGPNREQILVLSFHQTN